MGWAVSSGQNSGCRDREIDDGMAVPPVYLCEFTVCECVDYKKDSMRVLQV